MLKGYDKNFEYKQKTGAPVVVKGNYHTHNYLCGHAGGTVSDFAEEAVKKGLIELGVSDHCKPPVDLNYPFLDLYTMDDAYLPRFDAARKKYEGKLKIFSGVEIEYFAGYDDYYKGLLSKLDYLVLGQHFYMRGATLRSSYCDGVDDENVLAYFDNVKAGLRSGYFSLLAHPDLIFKSGPKLTRAIEKGMESVVTAAKECGVPLELNANGVRNHNFDYPTDLLVGLCKAHNAPVVVSADAHTPVDLCDSFVTDLYAFAVDNGLNVVWTLGIKAR